MKKITLLALLLVSQLLLVACVSESGNNDSSTGHYTISSASSTAPTTTTDTSTPVTHPDTSDGGDDDSSVSTPTTPPAGADNWYRVHMHYGALLGQPHEWGESGGYLSLFLSENAYEGAYTMRLDSTYSLLPNQLLTYRGSDGQHYTTSIQSIDGNTVNLKTALKKNVWYGENAWNFYENPSHPNYRGYIAIADYAMQSLGHSNLNYGTHALLGDSWFSSGTIRDRLQNTLTNARFINLGIGGNTSWDLLSRFDSDVPGHYPNFVWIMTGTNDYWNYITASQYQQNLRELIRKIEALGAKPVIIDSSVGPINYGTYELTDLSRAYTSSIEALHNGY